MRNLSLVLVFLIAVLVNFTPLEAFLDHLFDFHFDRKNAGLQFDYEKYEGMSDVEIEARKMEESRERSRDRDNGRGTTREPDRDK